MFWTISIFPGIIIIGIITYYIIYPGGKKNWLKRKKEIDLYLNDIDELEDELHEFEP